MPTSFSQCLAVKPCFETKLWQKFPCKIHFSVVRKVVAQSTTLVIYLLLTENLSVISTLENIRNIEMDNY